jgi:anti-sigma B factor antagonist
MDIFDRDVEEIMIDVIVRGEFVDLNVSGNLDAIKSHELGNIVDNLINRNKKMFVFDLGYVTYLSSSGISVLISTLRKLKALHGHMFLSNLSFEVLKTMELVQIEGLFDIINIVEDPSIQVKAA